ncbi:uncharacterized protein LOC117291132 [Asterias rubens]|uniref:uncharacterized protein LOC117291132 n=1 Tax=Asterias rubens TaxID=7604 RepID=UPI001455BF0B|nr:uncharacterized protein LOC117291132 [Asterias rubens]
MPHTRELEIRYFHRGRSFRPSKPLHFLPPIKLTTGAEQHTSTPHETVWQRAATRGRGREKRHSRYRKMVTTIASYLTLGNVADMKFLCKDHVRPPQIVDDVTNARHLLALLENQRLLAENSLYFLQTLLYYIARPDLYQVVLDFRADRQDDYRNRGVKIKDEYQVELDEDSQRLELANELLKFRKDLKPRKRLNQVDVTEMRRKLNDLSNKMQENIITMQRPNAPKEALKESPEVDIHEGDLMENGFKSEEEPTADNLPLVRNSTPQQLVAQEPSPAEPFQESQSNNQVVAGGGPQSERVIECKESPELKVQDGNTLPKIVQTGVVTSANQEAPKIPDNERKRDNIPTKESIEDYYLTKDEFEIQAEDFGYVTPCPPPRETVLGISGTKLYDDVAIASQNSVKHRGVKNAYKPLSSNDRTASKLHQLRRLSTREQRGSPRRGVQRQRKGNQTRKAKNPGTSDNEETKETSSKTKEDLKLPDIYDKYARQTNVQHVS